MISMPLIDLQILVDSTEDTINKRIKGKRDV